MSIEIITRREIYEVRNLTEAEREKAMLADPNLFPGDMPCMVCHFRWMQHRGKLCPKRPGYFSLSLQRPVPPILGDTEFVPDDNFYREPNYEVS